jgi:general secretion pathway protein D
MSDYPTLPLRALTLACLAVIAGCANTQPKVPGALDFPRSGDTRTAGDFGDQRVAGPTETVIRSSPKPPVPIAGNLRPIAPQAVASEEAGNLSVSFDQMALPTFIQAVYGNILKVNYSIDPAVSARTELITFRTPKPLSAAKISEITGQLLKSYGVAVQDFGGVLRMVADTNTSSTLPLVRRGRAQPGVPLPLRPIFHYVETEAVRPQNFLPTLKSILGTKVNIEVDGAGGMLVSGQPDDVSVALELIQVFDQPGLRSQNTTRVVPRYWGADEFSRRLSEVLRSEGYGVGNQPNSGEPISVISIAPVNSVLIFSTSKEVLAHVLDWVQELDQLPTVQAGSAYFTYPVKNADAQELAKALNDLISGTAAASATGAPAGGTPAGSAAATTSSASRGKRVVVNNATNSLIFQGGSQEDYRQWLSLLVQLDKPVKSALIDVLVAEVALTDNSDLGFAWRLGQLGSGAQAISLSGTTYNVQASGAGLAINALLGGNALRTLAINALAGNSDSRIMSNPKVMTRNGESATISVGADVPIVTSQAVAQTSGTFASSTTTVPQTVQYRNTGVILRVRPIIHAGDRIDVEISQEVSGAVLTTTGVTSSPTINRRSIETKLTLRDGATVMLGGIISDDNTDSDSGLPGLKDIPVLGNLFKSSSRSRARKELVILITPYILNDSNDAEAATDSFNNSLGQWADGVRDRVNAARAARKLRTDQFNSAPPDQDTAPVPSLLPPPTPTPQKNLNPSPRVQPSTPLSQPAAPAGSQPQPASSAKPAPSRMINLGNQTGAPEQSNSGSAAVPDAAAPRAPASPAPLPPGYKPAPRVIDGFNTPEGSSLVDDPKLREEILKQFKR